MSCHVEGCTNSQKYTRQGVCIAHYNQVMKYGDIIANLPDYKRNYGKRGKSKKPWQVTPNKFNTKNGYAEMELCYADGTLKAVALVDIEDIERITKSRWCYLKNKYVFNRTTGYLHIFLMGKREKMYVDHINRNTLDNRKSNLRFVTPTQSAMNKGQRSDNTSGIRGLSWSSDRNKWEVKIQVNKKTLHLGRFTSKEDAIEARKEAEKKYFGEFNPN